MRIALLTRSLTRGGAQVQICSLARGLVSHGHEVTVVTFYGGVLEQGLTAAGVRVHHIGKAGRWSNVRPMLKLRRFVLDERIDVMYSFLAMENLMGLVVSRLTGKPIVWGMRGSNVDRSQFGFTSRILYALQFRLLALPDAVISNSVRALEECGATHRRHAHVVPNGIDTGRYAISQELRKRFRASHGLGDGPVIGIVARLDPMKDHQTFLRAAKEITGTLHDARIVVAGDGMSTYRLELIDAATRLGLGGAILWLGEVADPEAVYNGLDVLVSSSAYGEGFSNVIAEGMSCGLPVVATDVGDSAIIVEDCGALVRPGAPAAIADAVVDLLNRDTLERREQRRSRIIARFSEAAMIMKTEAILEAAVSERQRTG